MNDYVAKVFLVKAEIESIISALQASPEWSMKERAPIIDKLQRQLQGIKRLQKEDEGPDYLVGI
jgi:hypothetical protein